VHQAEPPVGRRWPPAVRAFRHRDFRLFWAGLLISVIGTWMQNAAQAWLVYELTGSSVSLGVVGACGTLPLLFLTLPSGVIADRFRKRNIVLFTQTMAMVQAFILAALIYAHLVQVWHVMVLAALLGAVNALDMPTRQAMVAELASREDLLNAVSLNSSAFNAGRIIGPAIGGVLIAEVGTATCFLINGISFGAIIVALALVAPRPPAHSSKAPMLSQIADGIAWATGERVVRSLLLLTAVASIFGMSYATLLPVFAKDVFHTGAKGYGFLMSSYAAGALTSAFLLTSMGYRWRLGTFLTFGTFIFPVALLGVALSPYYGLAVIGLFLTGVGMMLFNAVSNTILQQMPPDELRGRVMSMRALLFAGMMPLGSLQVGALGEWLGPRAAVAIGGAICLAVAALAWRGVPELRRSA
jgi:MFS family permease